jgi:hypothetical protein
MRDGAKMELKEEVEVEYNGRRREIGGWRELDPDTPATPEPEGDESTAADDIYGSYNPADKFTQPASACRLLGRLDRSQSPPRIVPIPADHPVHRRR